MRPRDPDPFAIWATRIDPDLAHKACAVAAIFFGATSLYALDPSAMCDHVPAIMFALIGLWFTLVAAADVLGDVSEHVMV